MWKEPHRNDGAEEPRRRMTVAIWLFMLLTTFISGGVGVVPDGGGPLATRDGSVAGLAPADGADQVAVGVTIRAIFKSDMDPATFSAVTFRVSGRADPVSGTVGYDAPSRTATFTPLAPLLPLAGYTAALTTGVKDRSGHPLTASYSWAFMTARDTLTRTASEVIPLTLFGMHVLRGATIARWPAVGFKTWRLHDNRVGWADLEPRKGEWHFEKLDQYVSLAQQHRVEILLTLGQTPAWAAARPNEPSGGGAGHASEPREMAEWRTYVRTVATRYKGRIRAYEIWNEPNLKEFFTGSPDQLVDMAREAHAILKDIDPANAVVSPGITRAYGIPWLERYLSKGGAAYADVIGYHFYVTPERPEAMIEVINAVKKALARNGITQKPLWNTETGWAKGKTFASDAEAAAYVARSYILSWAAGVDRLYWYHWDDHAWVSLWLTDQDSLTLKPAAIAYDETSKWLTGARMISCGRNAAGTWVVRLNRGDASKRWIVWNPDKPTTFAVPGEWDAKQVKDLAGNRQRIAPMDRIEIGTAPVLVESRAE